MGLALCGQGSPFVSADLIRAGVGSAASAMVFKQRLGSDSEVSLVDADVVCIYRFVRMRVVVSTLHACTLPMTMPVVAPSFRTRLVKTQNPRIEVVCELVSKASIGYLSASSDGNEYMSPAFASGHVFTPALLDNLMAQSYYSPHVRCRHDLGRKLSEHCYSRGGCCFTLFHRWVGVDFAAVLC